MEELRVEGLQGIGKGKDGCKCGEESLGARRRRSSSGISRCSRMFENVRECSEMFGECSVDSSRQVVDGSRCGWVVGVGACPGLAGSSQFNWSQPQNYVRRQAAPASDGFACSVDADKCGCCELYCMFVLLFCRWRGRNSTLAFA
jgi:hypothetical protein